MLSVIELKKIQYVILTSVAIIWCQKLRSQVKDTISSTVNRGVYDIINQYLLLVWCLMYSGELVLWCVPWYVLLTMRKVNHSLGETCKRKMQEIFPVLDFTEDYVASFSWFIDTKCSLVWGMFWYSITSPN